MSNKMLIDASHPEETRVVVLRGNRVEEFDFEAADRQQLRGNIYLAKVTRVEPSLQAAFVEYGGNRHGFLAFSEIHPDYYQIPYADRQALLQEHAEEAAEDARQEDAQSREEAPPSDDAPPAEASTDFAAAESDDPEAAGAEALAAVAPAETVSEEAEPSFSADESSNHPSSAAEESEDRSAGAEENGDADHEHEEEPVESVGAEDALEELPERRKPRPRQYKIQEVIKRRQVMLVQVVKEERGNKGAALTTYLSLAGRYSVLMPNTARGGGISRKITTPADRKRLKEIAGDLDVPEGMGVILRTAGANRTKTEIKRDFEYLLRLWENVRELTLKSSAPKLVYEEGSLIKRAIRDLYSREIEQVVVSGEPAYREAKDFMRMLMPSHARNVQLYRDEMPIFSRNGVEGQLDAMFSPQVTLKSGGYIVINQTEALVSIDVNSGRSTREHSIEDTALNTNLEASDEIARQLRLRDLAGLIVIDFIDMEEKRNNRSVERRLKDCLRADRARIQLGRISHFGLMEMSRQRIRTGVLESSTVLCPHCRGSGQVRSISSLSLQILRAIEDYLLRHSGHHLLVRTRPEVALYVLNQKRLHLAQLEERFGLSISISGEAPENGAGFSVERGAPVEDRPERAPVTMLREPPPPEPLDDEVDEERIDADEEPAEAEAGEGRDRRRRSRRRRRGNGDDRHERRPHHAEAHAANGDEADAADEQREAGQLADSSETEAERESRRRRRGRRGGRRRGRGRENGDRNGDRLAPDMDVSADDGEVDAGFAGEIEPEGAHRDAFRDDLNPLAEADAHREPAIEPEPVPSDQGSPEETFAEASEPEPVPVPAPPPPEPEEDNRPKRSGWWSRKASFF